MANNNYTVRIATPGEYRLYMRGSGHDNQSRLFAAWIEELCDGPQGAIADWYWVYTGTYADFRTYPWQSEGFAEEELSLPSDEYRPTAWHISDPGDYTLRLSGRHSGIALDAFVLQLADLPAPTGNGPDESRVVGANVFLETEGRVTVEAEHFSARTDDEARYRGNWLIVPDEDPGDVTHHHHRGTGYIQALPDSDPTREERLARDITEGSRQIEENPENNEAWYRRGMAYAELGQWANAAADLAKHSGPEEHHTVDAYYLALSQLGARDVESYRKTCAGMLEAFGQTDEPGDAHWAAWSCALASDAVADLGAAVRLAEMALEKGDNPNWYSVTLAAVLYRVGRWDETVELLNEDAVTAATSYSPAYAWYFRAMAHHRLGQVDEARQWLEKAVTWANEETEARPAWNRRLTLQLLRDEAESLINGTEVARAEN